MANKKTVKTLDLAKNIEANLDEINNVESFISQILQEENFNKINIEQANMNQNSLVFCVPDLNLNEGNNENIEFVSIDIDSLAPYSTLISEKEFFKIVGVSRGKLSKRSGLYQESLYNHYLTAKEEQDKGYITDILKKAIVFQNNLNYVKMLMRNKKFMKEWRANIGNESPAEEFKRSGNLRKINIINERIS